MEEKEENEEITLNILKEQEKLEIELEIEEENYQNKNKQNEIPIIPKLLQVYHSGEAPDISILAEKTQELKAKGKQLDLLLLKAEAYSHFIRENQERCRREIESGSSYSSHNNNSSNNNNNSSSSSSTTTNGKKSRKRKISDENENENNNENNNNNNNNISLSSSSSSFKVTPLLSGGTLLPYQIEGLKWLLSLWENGLSGILADEMGLGKTIQIISLIAQLRSSGTSGPFLIAGPLSVLTNWIHEFGKWLPSCPTVLYHGTKQERQKIRQTKLLQKNVKTLNFPIVITSFEICMIDRRYLEKYQWQYIILDEGHRIKNRNCKLIRELKQIPSVSRLLLTGTPIQNTLEELWSLLNFVNPQIFDNLEVFQAWFGFKNIGKDTQVDEIIDNEQQTRIVSKLHEILRPFLLRRMKRDVLIDMPDKREIVLYCDLTPLQLEYYNCVLSNKLRETLISVSVESSNLTNLSNPIMQLRKVCNHPFLFGEPRDPTSGQYLTDINPELLYFTSGKFRLLDRLLKRLYEGGHKVLIFSQMTKLLNILERYLEYKSYSYCYIDGSVPIQERQSMINHFNSCSHQEKFIFLLSTRSGGLGINLTSADVCILFDSDWNPHQDNQAQDRCHRIGQRTDVLVYRLLTINTVEINMMEKQISKKKLDRLTMHGGDFRQAGRRQSQELTITTLRKLLEDDVRGLNRRKEGKTEEKENEGDSTNSSSTRSYIEIDDEQLDLLVNKEKIFEVNSETGEYIFPTEGDLYDIVTTSNIDGMLNIQGVE